jgi:folate-binding protein YgfZ
MSNHFGNPLQEQRQLLLGRAFVHRTDESVIELTGSESLKWLHTLTSQNLANLKPGQSAEALILDPHGHIEHQLKVIATEQGAQVITAQDRAAGLIVWLQKMKFRTQVEIVVSDLVVVGVFGDNEFDFPCWVDAWGKDPVGSARYAKDAEPFGYKEFLVGNIDEIDLPQAGLMAYSALRIAAGRPEISDVDERSLPHEYDWLSSSVHLSKGCYRGQETVAKVHNLGHPPRRLALLHLEVGDVLAQPGEGVFHNDREVGKVLASALHFEEGSLALALLGRVTPYTDLKVAGVSASQQILVPADAGKAANLPRPSAFKLSGKK